MIPDHLGSLRGPPRDPPSGYDAPHLAMVDLAMVVLPGCSSDLLGVYVFMLRWFYVIVFVSYRVRSRCHISSTCPVELVCPL